MLASVSDFQLKDGCAGYSFVFTSIMAFSGAAASETPTAAAASTASIPDPSEVYPSLRLSLKVTCLQPPQVTAGG